MADVHEMLMMEGAAVPNSSAAGAAFSQALACSVSCYAAYMYQIADAVLFLSSESASYITGETLNVVRLLTPR